MNHQPFETWLLSEEPLSPDDAQSLQTHLDSCEHCRDVEAAWLGVVNLFDDVPDMEPPSGFMNRWQEKLARERQLDLMSRHRWQSLIMLILIGNVIAGLVFLLGTQFLTTFETPVDLIMPTIYRFTSLLTFVSAVQNIFETIFRTFTSIVPLPVWAALGAGLFAAGAIWVISLKTLSVLPRRTLQ